MLHFLYWKWIFFVVLIVVVNLQWCQHQLSFVHPKCCYDGSSLALAFSNRRFAGRFGLVWVKDGLVRARARISFKSSFFCA